MRISDWSSDVCSSDLIGGHKNPALHRHRRLSQIYYYCCALDERPVGGLGRKARRDLRDEFFELGMIFVGLEMALPEHQEQLVETELVVRLADLVGDLVGRSDQAKIGRASCRERECQYV